MARWGRTLFKCRQDVDLADDILVDFCKGSGRFPDIEMSVYGFLNSDPTDIRARFDSGIGDSLMATYRAQENDDATSGYLPGALKYKVIILSAMMMHVGANIKQTDREHARALVSVVTCNEGYVSPLLDQGFRGPGKRQYLAALDNYKVGVPRSFIDPSCYGCGKIKDDIGKGLSKCARCQAAYYCDKDCQRAHWRAHKADCVAPLAPPAPGMPWASAPI